MRFGLQDADASSSDSGDEALSPLPRPPLSRSARFPLSSSTAPNPLTRQIPPAHSSVRVGSARAKLPRPLAPADSPSEPFNPTPLRLVRPPSLRHSVSQYRPRQLAPPSPTGSSSSSASYAAAHDLDSSSEEEGQDDNDDDDLAAFNNSDSHSDFDSEEEAWPVGPINSIGPRGWRKQYAPVSAYKGKGRAADSGRRDPPRLFGAPDAFDVWNDQARASSWAAANRTFHLSLARQKSLSPSPLTINGPPPGSRSAGASSGDLASVEGMLSQLALQQKEETAALVRGFEQRNAALWDSIEASIRAAEEEEGERQRVLAEARRREEEAQRRAQEMREEAERKAQEERKRKEEEEKKRAEAQAEQERKDEEARAKRAEEERAAAAKASALGMTAGDAEGTPEAEFKRWTAKMQHIKQTVLPVVSQNPTWRKACFQAKRAITPKIGQLTSSAEATARIISQLDDVLNSMRAGPPQGPGAPEPYTWTLNHLAKALVKQAETEVTAKLGTAYPLGRIVIGLLLRGHVELGDVLMARLVKKCFWLTAHWPRKLPGESDEAHQKVLGHAPPGSSETLVQYAERMSGLVALYAAIFQTSPLSPPQAVPSIPSPSSATTLAHVPPHFRPAAGWRWLVLMLRPPLVTLEPTPLLLVTFLEIAGATLLDLYGRQMAKLLECLLREGVRDAKAGFSEKAKGSQVRLLLWLEEWEKTGKAECAQGREPDP